MGNGFEEGFTLRAPGLDDLDAVLALIRACEEVDEGNAESTADDLRTNWRLLGDLARDAWLISTLDEPIVGYANIWQRVEGIRFESDGYTHPEFRGRGIGTTLVRAVEERAREQAQDGATLRTAVNHANDEARRLLENEEYSPVRSYWRMVIDFESPPASPQWPDGVLTRPYEPERDERAVHTMIQQAFADNYDYSPLPLEAWRAAIIERDDFDPSLVRLATYASDIVGSALCFRYDGHGWVRTLAVLEDWRRRGVGMGLLRSAFAEFYRRGQRSAGLVVDSFNRTGAKEFYERAGMRVERQHDGYEKVLGARNRK
ncbi:MAG TPA: GNAT family N-acetyltransferase [Dehalococcoidia bacterium]|jgi:mycothiol synthase|nr:GNAT family N-acetyltransferase [Dehalococcoidia bacterium]